MYPLSATVTESCTHCPHFDTFHGSCGHEMRQSVIRELATKDDETCPIFSKVHAEAMQDLEIQQTA